MAVQNRVLEDAKYVMHNKPAHVKIDEAAIDLLAKEWSEKEIELPKWDFFVDMSMSPEERFDHFLIGDCLNFAYTDFETGETYETEHNGQVCPEAFGMFTSLMRAEKEGVPVLDGQYLKEMTVEKLKGIFKEKTPMPMLEERVEILRAVGKKLVEKYDGRFHNILGGRHTVGINEFVNTLVEEFPEAFNDISSYKGWEVKFYKRANLAAAQAYENLAGTGFFEIEDTENSVVFADYDVPKALRHYGILVYSNELAHDVDNGKIIEAGSEKEVEIRAGTVLGTDMLKERINFYREKMGKPALTNLHLDKELWFAAKPLPEKHHLTRTTAY